MAGGPRSVSSHRGGHYRVRAMIPAETGAVVSSANESELLPACLSHLRVSVISVGPSRVFLSEGVTRVRVVPAGCGLVVRRSGTALKGSTSIPIGGGHDRGIGPPRVFRTADLV